MIKKLRVKLIVASMISLLLVLVTILGTMSILNYHKIISDADKVLAILVENDGRFPDSFAHPDTPKEQEEPKKDDRLLSPELPYESRYFSVVLNEDGNVVFCDTGKIAMINTETAIKYAKQVWESEKEKGIIGDYRYCINTIDEGTRVIFLDCRRNFNTFQSFIITGIGVSVVGLLAVLVLLILLSARIVKPFSENYEKQKRFITDAGHELKTPLTIIDADAEILEMDYGENEWLSDIQNQTKRLAELTNSLIFLAKMEEEQTKIPMLEFPISDMVEETVETFQALAKVQNKTLISDIEPMLSLKGDEKAIRRLITILLDNAVKYSGEEGKISLTLKKQKNHIHLSVWNTTEQISKGQIAHLFDRFYRTDESRNSETGGYGLGLSIASATVRAHKGKISAETEDGKSLRIMVVFSI